MKKITIYFLILFSSFCYFETSAQHSVARNWNEALLEAIRSDISRPTVHARNLFHSAILMYDAWAIFDTEAQSVFLGKQFGGFNCTYNGISTPSDVEVARHEIMSYALFRLLSHRFANSPGAATTLESFVALMTSSNYDINYTSEDYSDGNYAALGNYLGAQMIAFGLQDNSNEQNDYANVYYTPINDPMIMQTGFYSDTYELNDPNRWQPLAFETFVDQSGNVFPQATPAFLSPEWGSVTPFSLKSDDLEILNNSFNSYVYNNPGPPPYIQNSTTNGIDDPFKWNFALVAAWSSHLDPDDPTTLDISPASMGNIDFESLPETFEDYKNFYSFLEGGYSGTGYGLNPITNIAYEPQIVKRGDYTRVLAEFWADGPDSETPPGHWFTILNYVSDHPLFEKRFSGTGSILDDLEWDVKTYLTLGSAMHDCAVNIWGIKGYYDYVRPVSAIRYMAGKGQSTDVTLPSYDPHGLPLIEGYIELIASGDELAGSANEHVGKLKIFAWKGPDFINDPNTDVAHVGWILGTQWWPYQRPTFVSPPFAGYLSGHSAFSRAAAEVMTSITGSQYFPGGMGVFDADQNEFLVFEQGPSESIQLEWATYRDASDQCSLSRINGGIHPPIDDIKARMIGRKIGLDCYERATSYFSGSLTNDLLAGSQMDRTKFYPNPFTDVVKISSDYRGAMTVTFFSIDGKMLKKQSFEKKATTHIFDTSLLASGLYFMEVKSETNTVLSMKKLVKN